MSYIISCCTTTDMNKEHYEKFNEKYGHEPKVYEVLISDGARRL